MYILLFTAFLDTPKQYGLSTKQATHIYPPT